MPPSGEWCENATAAWVLEASALAMWFFAARRGRLAGAALLGEVRVAGHAEDNAEQSLVSRSTQRAELVLK